MTYFLDFDRTLFDVDAFYAYLFARPELRNVAEGDKLRYAAGLTEHTLAGTLTFEPGELSKFLYPDAKTFLLDKGNSAMIITSGNPIFQEAKVKSAIYGIPRIAVMYCDETLKGDFIKENIGMYGPTPVFVDDKPLQLENMQECCPGVQLFEMRREGGEGDSRFATVHALAELP